MKKNERGIFERPKGSKVWWICYSCQYGHIHREKIGPKGLAKTEYERRKVRVRTEGYCLTQERNKPRPVQFQDFAEEYLTWARVNKRSYKSTKAAMKHLVETFKGKTLGEITARQIEAYKAERAAKVAPATVNRELALLRHLYNQAIAWGKTETNPAKGVKLFKENNERVRYLTSDEEARLFASLPGKYKPVVALALHTGLRMGELRGLRWRDVDFEADVITVAEAKGGRVQHVPMNGIARATLEVLSRRGPYVFTDLPTHLSERFKELAEKAGVKDFRFHDLRHTFCSRLVMAGVDIRTVQVLARHKEIRMTLRYAHLSEDHTKQAIERLIPGATGTATGTVFVDLMQPVESTRIVV